MNTHPTPTNDYLTDRYDLVRRFEGQYLYAYNDSVGIATIGVGINLSTVIQQNPPLHAHGRLVLQALGFDMTGTRLQGAARPVIGVREQYLLMNRNCLLRVGREFENISRNQGGEHGA
jgi:hypothetical protein